MEIKLQSAPTKVITAHIATTKTKGSIKFVSFKLFVELLKLHIKNTFNYQYTVKTITKYVYLLLSRFQYYIIFHLPEN